MYSGIVGEQQTISYQEEVMPQYGRQAVKTHTWVNANHLSRDLHATISYLVPVTKKKMCEGMVRL